MIIGVIQARLTSTRLPGKVLLKVLNKPLLKYMIERLSLSKELDDFFVAIPNNKDNEFLQEFLEKSRIKYVLGSENDVLQRFYKAGIQYEETKALVRLTADCPLIDPQVVDRIIKYFRDHKNIDYVRTGPTFADGQGVEVFSFEALEVAHKEAVKQTDREHVTTFFKNNPERFHCVTLNNDVDETSLRYTVDTPADLEVVKKIIEKMDSSKYFFGSKEIREFLFQHPEVRKLNQSLQRAHLDGKI